MTTKNNKIVISGLGVASTHGFSIKEFWKNIKNQKLKVQSVPEQWHKFGNLKSKIWVPFEKIDFAELGFNRADILRNDPAALLTIYAAEKALKDAKLELKEKIHDRVGVYIGTGIAGVTTLLNSNITLFLDLEAVEFKEKEHYGKQKLNLFTVSKSMPNAIAASLGIRLKCKGANQTITKACASGTSAIDLAFKDVENGVVDFAICGGVEYVNDNIGGVFRSFDKANTLCKARSNIIDSNRPFDKERTGFLMSEGGCGILIIEKEHTAKSRGTEPYVEILNSKQTFDAYSMMAPIPSGDVAKKMILDTLQQSQISMSEINYINSHGTGTKANDQVESEMLLEIFGDKPVVNSSKSILGHSIGASGAFEAIITALSIQNSVVHGNANLCDAIAPLNLPKKTINKHIRFAISLSYAFGGHNAIVLFKEYQ